jgi:thiamine biosynthesis lipoprotein
MVRERFRAMGTAMEILVDARDGRAVRAALAAARGEIARLERLLSRFDPASELSRLNRAGRLDAGPDLVRVLGRALDLRRRTGGRFDPTLGRAVRAAGYDRDLAGLGDDPRPPGPAAPGGGRVELDRASGRARLGPGVAIDLGGIAKGDAADRACALIGALAPCLVNAGGDLAASGPRRDGGAWDVGIATGEGELVIALARGGLATSGVDRRRWRRGGTAQHHAIDPVRGRPATTGLVRATAVAATGAEADALATALLVAGHDAPALADAWGVPAVLVPAGGPARLAGGLA